MLGDNTFIQKYRKKMMGESNTVKSFHNGPIETTGILSWSVPDETLYTVQSNFLGFLTSYVKCP